MCSFNYSAGLPPGFKQYLHILNCVHFLDTVGIYVIEPSSRKTELTQIGVVACIEEMASKILSKGSNLSCISLIERHIIFDLARYKIKDLSIEERSKSASTNCPTVDVLLYLNPVHQFPWKPGYG